MAWALRYVSVGGTYISFPALSIASGENFSIEMPVSVDATGIARVIGGSVSNTTSRVWVQQNATPNFRITNAAGTSADWNYALALSAFYVFKLVRTGSALELFIDGVSQGTRTLSGSFSFDRFFAHATSAGVNCTIKYVDITSAAGSRSYINNSGTGNVWVDVVSGQNGTQVGGWPSDDSEWVFYSSGGSTAATQIKLFDGTAFTNKTIKRWNGSAFVDVTLKRWNGSAFVDL